MAILQELHWRPVVKREPDQRDNAQLAHILPTQQNLYFPHRFNRTTPILIIRDSAEAM